MTILVISTGGTIGALPYDDPEKAPKLSSFSNTRDFVREALENPPFNALDLRYLALEARDSKDIDVAYLDLLTETIAGADEAQILVTHGTDALLSTAEFLDKQLQRSKKLKDKNIVLVGSMIPLANGPQADGYQNLSFALGWLKDLEIVQEQPAIHFVLCDYEHPETKSGGWKPHLYSYEPGVFEKLYAADSRYNRIRRKA